MKRSRWAVLTVGVVTVLATAHVSSVGATVGGQTKQALKATEIGVTDKEIRIAVIADNDTPLAPGLFKKSAEAVQAFAKYINSKKGGGGLAGRKVVVDFIDSKLNPDETRNAIIKACQNDFAMVGTTALFVNNVDDMVQCKDANGKATGIPDIPELTTDPKHQNSPVSFPIIAAEKDFSDASGRTYHVRIGPYRWFQKNVDKNLHGIFLIPADLQSTRTATLPGVLAAQKIGVKKDDQFDVHGRDSQDMFLPYTQSIKSNSSNIVRNGSNDVAMANMRKEAQTQGVTSVKVWYCSLACYSTRFLQQAGAAGEGQYVDTFFVPLEEAKKSPPVKAFLDSVGGAANTDGFGAQAWVAALAFKQVVNSIAKANVNGLTRAKFLDEIRKVHDFSAEGMIGKVDLGGKKPSGCFTLLQAKGGKWVRVWPKKTATFDCSPSNLYPLNADIEGAG
ncbi:MAG: ABC transporter substrate-binding protein [Acidimicrobiia bacterium]